MVAITVIGILAAIAVPSYIGHVENAKEEVCDTNVVQLERMYEAHLTLENKNHTEDIFDHYLQEYGRDICPENGDIYYVGGEVRCGVHSEEGESDDEDESIPFL